MSQADRRSATLAHVPSAFDVVTVTALRDLTNCMFTNRPVPGQGNSYIPYASSIIPEGTNTHLRPGLGARLLSAEVETHCCNITTSLHD